MLVLLYYLSQNPDFSESIKPLMGQLKNSEEMLHFLKNLSQFTQTFSTFKGSEPYEKESGTKKTESTSPKSETKEQGVNEKTPQSPTTGIADEFIQKILESYLKKH